MHARNSFEDGNWIIKIIKRLFVNRTEKLKIEMKNIKKFLSDFCIVTVSALNVLLLVTVGLIHIACSYILLFIMRRLKILKLLCVYCNAKVFFFNFPFKKC